MEIPQLKGDQPIFYIEDYPSNAKFVYGDFNLNYRFIEQKSNP